MDKWNSKINPFFLNSKITQPAFGSQKKKDETYNYFKALLDETIQYKEGICRISGLKTRLFPAGRDNSFLSGSNTFVNFHHSFEKGIFLSKEIIIRFHFLPLACELLQGRVSFINCNVVDVIDFFASDNCRKNLNKIALNVSSGILSSESKSAGTALFRQIDKILANAKQRVDEQNYLLSLYMFSNFGASPELKMYTLPFNAFKFYCFTQKAKYKQEWSRFVANYYRNSDYKKLEYDETTNTYSYEVSHKSEKVEEESFSYWRNSIYEDLINEKSILDKMLRWTRRHGLCFDITKMYMINIRNMKKETIKKIEQIADYILSSNDEDGIKKAIKKIDAVKSAFLLRRFVIKDVVAKYYNEAHEEAIVTVEDYANYLFPDVSSWQEMRDVLLIAIFQKLHERNQFIGQELNEEDEEL